MPSSTAPSVPRVDASDVEGCIEAIKEHGCVIIENFTTRDLVEKVNAETRPYLDADKPWKGALFPEATRRCNRLVSRSPTFRTHWLTSPTADKISKTFISKTTHNFYGNEKHTYTTDPIIDIALTMEVNPGSYAQRLHRDDKNHHVDHIDQTKTGYQMGQDVGIAFLVPGTETTYENGATMAIPGSHLWGPDRAPQIEEAAPVLMKPGECLAFLGSLYHGGGTNTTKDVRRPMHSFFFCRGTLRGEENPYLTYTKEEVLSWAPEVQKKMGYTPSSPNINVVDFMNPIDVLKGVVRESYGDVDPEPEMEIVNAKEAVAVA
ncbi:MAG: hypothetical protein M1834_003043 [Cirrosporium novae-zelandiae]|nr:MAG: hypothetical protein M1834_003043 [Cirrosporium novae-zelandiae]